MFNFFRKKRKERNLKKELASILREIYATDPTSTDTIRTAVFDCKYEKDLAKEEEMTPSELVEEFKKQAERGDREFLRHYFYRILRRNYDPVLRVLKHRLRRS